MSTQMIPNPLALAPNSPNLSPAHQQNRPNVPKITFPVPTQSPLTVATPKSLAGQDFTDVQPNPDNKGVMKVNSDRIDSGRNVMAMSYPSNSSPNLQNYTLQLGHAPSNMTVFNSMNHSNSMLNQGGIGLSPHIAASNYIQLEFVETGKAGRVKSVDPVVEDHMRLIENKKTRPPELVSCIFKVFDDIRQDGLALQIIRMFQAIFKRTGLELHVFPYKTISNRTGESLNIGGIIEVVPNAISRDQMGKTNNCSLYEYFLNKFGSEDSMNFQIARENFIRSQSAYSIISYILQIKDRHNGNILIDNKGHLIHIDFGFIFDISPAGNLKFESANFKLTREMIEIMGGAKDSEPFQF